MLSPSFQIGNRKSHLVETLLAYSTPDEIFIKFVENRGEEFTKVFAERAKSMHPIIPSSCSSPLSRRGSGRNTLLFSMTVVSGVS